MKRTKDGGVILKMDDDKLVKLTKDEFEVGRMKRDVIRIGAFLFAVFLDFWLLGEMLLPLGILLVGVGWRLKTGW